MQRRTLMKSALAAAAFGSLPLKAAWAEDVPAITLEGDSTTLDKGDIRAFAESFNGVEIGRAHV